MTDGHVQDAEQGLICAFDLNGEGGGQALEWAEINHPQRHGTTRWVHLDFTRPAARHWLRMESGMPESIVDAMLQEDIRPRSLQTPQGLLTVLRGVNLNPGSDAEDMVSIRVWLESDRIVTVRRRRLMSVMQLADEVRGGSGPTSSASFVTDLISKLGDRISEVIDNLDDVIEQAEADIAMGVDNSRRGIFSTLRRKTARIRRYLAPQREALDRLSRFQSDLFSMEDLVNLQEETNRMTLFVEDLDLARERAMVAQEEILNTLAHEQNSKMYLLSMVAAIFLPLSFLTGVFGMNVAGLPGLENPAAFMLLSIAMVAIGIAILGLFRWKKWL